MGIPLLLSACSSTAPSTTSSVPADFPDHTVGQIRGQILLASDTLRSFSARARITVRTPERTQSFTAVIRQRRSDSLYMKLSKMGFEGGRLLLTQDSVFFFDTREAVLRVGPVSAAQRLIPVPVSSDRLFQNMLGLIAPSRKRTWSVQSDSSFYYLSNAARSVNYVVDPKRWRVVRYEEKTSEGTALQKHLFSDFQPVQGVQVPRQLIFRRPTDELTAVVNYREVTLNPLHLPMDLHVPPQVPRVSFR